MAKREIFSIPNRVAPGSSFHTVFVRPIGVKYLNLPNYLLLFEKYIINITY